SQPVASVKTDTAHIRPMYDRRMFAVDLATTVRVAMARNIDIQAAQEHVAASHGEYEASIGMIFPSIQPNITARGLKGAVATPAGLAVLSFNHIFPTVLLQWIINPGQVAYDIIASKRRLEASDQRDRAVVQETMRAAAVQYLRCCLDAGSGCRRPSLSGRGGGIAPHRASPIEDRHRPARRRTACPSCAGCQTAESVDSLECLLRCIGGADGNAPLGSDGDARTEGRGIIMGTTLVREDLSIDDMLVTAARYRPDLEAIRTLVAAAEADVRATVWGGLGPQITATRTFTKRPPAKTLADTEYREQTYVATGGFDWSAATFGRIRTAVANAKIAELDAERQLDLLQASVVAAHQT